MKYSLRIVLLIPLLIIAMILVVTGFWQVAQIPWLISLILGTSYGNMRKQVKTPVQDISSILSLITGIGIFVSPQKQEYRIGGALIAFLSATIFVVRQKNTLTKYQQKYGSLESNHVKD